MEVGGQSHSSYALPWERETVFYRRLEWASVPVWTGAKNFAHTGIRTTNRLVPSESLHELRYPGHIPEIFVIKGLQEVTWHHMDFPKSVICPFNLSLDLMLICRQREKIVKVTMVSVVYCVVGWNFFLHATKYVVQQEIATGTFLHI